MRILITGAGNKRNALMIGRVGRNTIALAIKRGINIAGGCVNRRDGRVRIFVKGKFPGAHKSGYALRSRVVWWLHTGEILTGCDVNLHHCNGDRADDRFFNLMPMPHREHAQHHNPPSAELVDRICKQCGGAFKIKKWRLKDKARGTFCGQECYQAHPKSLASRQKRSATLKGMYAEGWRQV